MGNRNILPGSNSLNDMYAHATNTERKFDRYQGDDTTGERSDEVSSSNSNSSKYSSE